MSFSPIAWKRAMEEKGGGERGGVKASPFSEESESEIMERDENTTKIKGTFRWCTTSQTIL